MKKRVLAAVLACMACGAKADVVVPAGADLPARISSLTAHTVVVEVLKPATLTTVWDEIAASMAGCRIEGARSSSAGGRMSLDFNTLKCAGQPAIPIEAFGVEDLRRRVDLKSNAAVGTKLSVLVLSNITRPGGKPWTAKIR